MPIQDAVKLAPLVSDKYTFVGIQEELFANDLTLNVNFICDIPSIKKETTCFLTEFERDDYAENNQKLIYYIANKYHLTMKIDLDELISIAGMGFAKALNTFDKNVGVKFSTFVYTCMKNEILCFYRKEVKHIKSDVSLNKKIKSDSGVKDPELGDLIANKSDLETSNTVLNSERRELISMAILKLSQKEQYILTFRYGLINGTTKTQKDIADELGTSQANVSKMQRSAEAKMRTILGDLLKDDNISLADVI